MPHFRDERRKLPFPRVDESEEGEANQISQAPGEPPALSRWAHIRRASGTGLVEDYQTASPSTTNRVSTVFSSRLSFLTIRTLRTLSFSCRFLGQLTIGCRSRTREQRHVSVATSFRTGRQRTISGLFSVLPLGHIF
jgi:hypothetical protein